MPSSSSSSDVLLSPQLLTSQRKNNICTYVIFSTSTTLQSMRCIHLDPFAQCLISKPNPTDHVDPRFTGRTWRQRWTTRLKDRGLSTLCFLALLSGQRPRKIEVSWTATKRPETTVHKKEEWEEYLTRRCEHIAMTCQKPVPRCI